MRWPLREGESEAYTVERWVEAELRCASVLGRFIAVIIRDRVTSSLSRGETNSSVLLHLCLAKQVGSALVVPRNASL